MQKVATVLVDVTEVISGCSRFKVAKTRVSNVPEIGDKFGFAIKYTHTDKTADASGFETSNYIVVTVTVVNRPGAGGGADVVDGGADVVDNSITANALDQATDVYSDTASPFSLFGPSFSSEPTSLSGGSVTYSIDTSSY